MPNFLSRPRTSRPRQSLNTTFAPGQRGWTELPDSEAPASSIVSGQNLWVRRGRVEPRFRLTQLGTNKPTTGEPRGSTIYYDLAGTDYPVVMSAGTVSYLDTDTWTELTYVSGTSNLPPTGGDGDLWFGTTSYLTRRDLNVHIFTNGKEPVFTWAGPSDGIGYSTLTDGPICKDVALFDDRPVYWNIRELSSTSRFVTRVQWPIAANHEDNTGLGSGFEDLLHMRGIGTRIFADEDEMILASTREIWRGRAVGLPFVFDFSPIKQTQGIPYPNAALQTRLGIFWLGDDYMVYRMQQEQIEPIGEGIQRTLRDTALSLDKAFFTFSDELQQLTLHYTSVAANNPKRAFTLHIDESGRGGVWTPHRYDHELTIGGRAAVPSSSAATWGGLIGTLDDQGQSYNEALGSGSPDEMVLSSSGTAYYFSSAESLDDGQAVTGQVVTGSLWPDLPDRHKFTDQVRMEIRGDSASSLEVGVSADLGNSFTTREVAVSAASNSTQHIEHFTLSGRDHMLQFQSDTTGWDLQRVSVRGSVLGEILD